MNKNLVDYTLYLVTDSDLVGNKDFYDSIEQAILGGVTLVQLREKKLSTRDFYDKAVNIKKITDKYNVPLIINDRLDIALAVDADGLHIGQSDMPLSIARKIFGKDKIIGVSATNLEQAKEAEKGGADYIGVGAMFTTSTKLDAKSVSIQELKTIKQRLEIPVVAIGGINQNNAKQVVDTGIDGISVVSAILARDNVKKASEELINVSKL